MPEPIYHVGSIGTECRSNKRDNHHKLYGTRKQDKAREDIRGKGDEDWESFDNQKTDSPLNLPKLAQHLVGVQKYQPNFRIIDGIKNSYQL